MRIGREGNRAQGQNGANYEYDAVSPGGGIEGRKKVLAQNGALGW